MKKKVIIGALMALLLLSCSGNGEKAVRDYALQFAKAVSSGDSSSVVKMYPDAALADSLALSFVEDSLKIESNEKGDSILIHYTSDIWVRALKDENDSLRIISSRGLFVYNADVMEFANSTGQFNSSLTDLENAERMNDKEFKPWLIKKHIKTAAEKFKVVGKPRVLYGEPAMSTTVTWEVTVKSTSDQPISGADYKVYFKGENKTEPINWSENGEDVPPKGSVNIMTLGGMWTLVNSAYVNTTLSEEAYFNKYFKPTGKEYEEFLAERKL